MLSSKKMKYPRILTEEEVALVFSAAGRNKRDEMLLKCLYYLGLKSNEVQKMMVSDVDVRENTVAIRGKNGRELMIPGAFPFELAKFNEGREGLVFSGNGEGGSLSDRHIRRIVKDYARMAGVRDSCEIKPHTLRISYAVHLRKDGLSVKTLQQLLGHSRRETTYMYTHGLSRISGEGQMPAERTGSE